MDVSIIIVNYNTRQLLYTCLVSIYEQTRDITYEVIVLDNGSIDNSINMVQTNFPHVILIENNKNIGFGAANNRGLDIAKGKYIFYLNSDTVLLNNAVKIFNDFWEGYSNKNELGAIGCNLLNQNMQVIHSSGKFPSMFQRIKSLLAMNINLFIKTVFRFFHYDYSHLRKNITEEKRIIGDVDFITGADLFMENDKTLKFDEHFFLYSEDVDLQYTLFSRGKKRLLIDGPLIQHLTGGSNMIKDDFERYASFSIVNNFISSILYFMKYKIKGAIIIKTLVILILINPYLIKETKKHIKKIAFLSYDKNRKKVSV
ncbi:glycosyl transferase [Spirochaetia bacterium]|nr:glycosyl transferase [Spirochaetia bacterium]